jgi:micrococcal nuclease
MGNCLGTVQQIVEDVAEANKQQQQQQGSSLPQQQHQPTTKPQAGGHASTSGALSPVYSSLPNGAEEGAVRNVYDGDTLTLTDERRVRFLGIDTPEVKEKQPFSQESKAYTKERCKQKVWLTFEGEKQDHYGRLLAFVWVKEANGYLCVNEGIVAAGLATVYTPDKNVKLHNWDKLLALQTDARNHKRGIWSTFSDEKVFRTANGAAYHKRSCEHLADIRNLTELTVSKAADAGLHPCRTCMS